MMWIKVDNTTLKIIEICINEISAEEGYSVFEIDNSDMPDDLFNSSFGFCQYQFLEDGYGSGVFQKYSDSDICDMCSACENEICEKEAYFDVRKNNYIEFYDGISVTASGTEYFSFPIPYNFSHLHELILIGIAETGGQDKQIDLYSQYSGIGQNCKINEESSIGNLFDLGSAGDKISIDISSVFTNISAGDTCALKIVHQAIGGKIYYQHIRMRYHHL